MMGASDYWMDALSEAFDEHGVIATPEQIALVARDVQGAHETYGMAFYSPPAGEHLRREVTETKKALEAERAKVLCRVCGGHGSLHSQGPYHSSTSQCWKCGGEGRHAP